MKRIRIVRGTGTGPTPMSSYDAALAAANVHNYNLVSVSSVIPAEASVETVGDAPPFAPAGERLTVVEATTTTAPETSDPAVACLGWTREPDGPGIFYESAGTDRRTVRERVETGLDAGRELRPWDFGDRHVRTAAANDDEQYTTAVVLAVYGGSEPLL